MTSPSDDASIAGDDLLYRRVHHTMVVSDGTGGERPSSAAFRPNDNDDDDGLSAYLRSALLQIPAEPADCLPDLDDYSLASLIVGEVRNRGHGVLRDPVTDADEPYPCDLAHALVTGFRTGKPRDKQARALSRQARWPA